MKNFYIKKIVTVLVLVSMLVTAGGCRGQEVSENGSTTGITITDSADVTITLPDRVEKIACTWPSGAQLFITLGMSDLLIAVPADTKEQPWAMHIAPEVKNLPDCRNEDSLESFLTLEADLIITTEPEVAKNLRDKGMTAITLNYYSVEEMKSAIRLLGSIVPEEYGTHCEDYLAYLEEQIAKVAGALDGKVAEKTSLYYINGNNNKGLYKTAGADTMNEAWANYAGTEFVTAAFLSSSETNANAEAVLATNPETIVIGGRYQRVLYDELLNTTEWKEITAVKNGRVFTAPLGVSPFDRFGAEFAMMIPWLASKVYPELYSFDAVAEIKNFYFTFSGYDMSEQEAGYIVDALMPDGTREIEHE